MLKRRIMLVALFTLASATLLSSCQTQRAPTWRVTATTSPVLQVKQINYPLSGTNYVLCRNCVHYNRVSLTPKKRARAVVRTKKRLHCRKPIVTQPLEKKHEKSCR